MARRGSVTRVVTPTISVRKRLREIWLSRELLIYLVRTEIKVKYKNSVLGLVWSMVAPAMTLAIYFFVFSILLDNKMPNFVIYLFAGLLLWNLFSLGVLTGTGVVVNNAGIVKKVSFPREILALAAVGSACVFFFFQSIVMVIFMVVLRAPPDPAYFPLLIVALHGGSHPGLGPGRAAVLDQRVPARHATPDRGRPDGLVLGLPDRVLVPDRRGQAGTPPPDVDLPGQPHDAAGPGLPALPLQQAERGDQRPVYTVIVPQHGYLWYAVLVGIVLVMALVLFLVALAIFGRLEGNFAEEL